MLQLGSCEPEQRVPVTTHYTGALEALQTTLCFGAEVKTLALTYSSSEGEREDTFCVVCFHGYRRDSVAEGALEEKLCYRGDLFPHG